MTLKAARRIHHQGIWCALFLQVLLVFMLATTASAQLARSFVTVTGITARKIPNAVQIRIETDGSAQFGTEQTDFINFDGYYPVPTQSLRIRIWRARAKLPAFVPLEAYPVDAAVVSLGREDLEAPAFWEESGGDAEPRVQVELRFAAPVLVRQFTAAPGRSINFGNNLGQLEARVEPSNDRRAIIVTIITDRADATSPQRLDRSPREARHSKLSVAARGEGRVSIEALHTPLRELLDGITGAASTRFIMRDQIANQEVSLSLPDTTVPDLLEALEIGYGIGARLEDDAVVLGRGDEFYSSRALPLQNLTPEKTRLLFPDFLLPSLRVERETNALLAVQTPAVLDKIEADLEKLDAQRAQFDIKVEAWEIASTQELIQTLQATRSVGGDVETLNLGTGTTSVRVESGLTAQIAVTLNALSLRGRARLVAAPHVTALSGEAGTLFLGQTRYIKVLQNRNGGQTAQALPLQIGTSLSVTPRGNDQDGDVLLAVSPRVSTVDDIEPGTGLPTLGIREASSVVRVRPGESVALAGLDFEFDSRFGGRTLKVFPAKRDSKEKRELLVLVSAQRLERGTTKEPLG